MLDSVNGNRRILQYLMEQWLVQSQDGWIFHKARTYRGAVQPEDEQKWADSVLLRAVASPMVRERYFMVRLLADRLPETVASKGLRERIRWTSRAISDSIPRFFAIRPRFMGFLDQKIWTVWWRSVNAMAS